MCGPLVVEGASNEFGPDSGFPTGLLLIGAWGEEAEALPSVIHALLRAFRKAIFLVLLKP
jgi:hypothetical protein